jgi:glucokinase
MALGRAMNWPVLALDRVKNLFLTELPPGDRLFNRRPGRASSGAIFDLIADGPRAIISSTLGSAFSRWSFCKSTSPARASPNYPRFGAMPRPRTSALHGARLGSRPKGHPGADYVPELIELAQRARPTGLAPCLSVETTRPLELAPLLRFLN